MLLLVGKSTPEYLKAPQGLHSWGPHAVSAAPNGVLVEIVSEPVEIDKRGASSISDCVVAT
jgi:hypothetical protein